MNKKSKAGGAAAPQKAPASSLIFKKELGLETFLFPIFFFGVFALFAWKMGLSNALGTMMKTAEDLLKDTVLALTAICVIMGAISGLLSEFGFVSLLNRVLQPLMKPVYGLPGAASLGVVTTFLSDNPAILSLAEDQNFRRYFKKYQFPALTNLGTAFGMGLIVCTAMYSCSTKEQPLGMAVLVGLLGAVVGSIVSTRLMLLFTKKLYGTDAPMETTGNVSEVPKNMRQVREGNLGSRIMGAILDGGHNGVKMGVSIVPGVLVICTLVMMLTNGSAIGRMVFREDGTYAFTLKSENVVMEGNYRIEDDGLILTDADGIEIVAKQSVNDAKALEFSYSYGAEESQVREFRLSLDELKFEGGTAGELAVSSKDYYTGAAYEGIALLPWLASKINFILAPLFGFTTPEAIGVPVTALGAAGAAIGLVPDLIKNNFVHANDIAVFTAMCMCWSGYLSTHTSMMDSLNCKELIGKAILSHTVGGLCAGVAAHWIFVLLSAIF